MNSWVILDCIQIIGFAILFFAPFDKRRVRAGWAKTIFILGSVIGIGKGIVGLAWDLGWLSLSSQEIRIYDAIGGLLLGFLFSLFFSGQLGGKKQPSNNALQPTATAP
jgi:hypothetical protein